MVDIWEERAKTRASNTEPPQSKDIFSTKNTILNITEADINTTIQQIRE